MANVYTLGELVRLTATFTDPFNSDVTIDPDEVRALLRKPSGAEVTYVYGTDTALKRLSRGVYYLETSANQVGTWYYQFWSVGDGQATDDDSFEVLDSDIPDVSSSVSERTCISPEDSLHDGCPVLGKTRYLVVSKGECACVEWPVRDRQGNSRSLGDIDHVVVRFQDALSVDPGLYELNATIVSSSDGVISFSLTSDLVNRACIWQFQIGLMDDADNLLGTDFGYLSVERGLFGDIENFDGPLTINEVRLQLRDTLTENELLDDVEFDDVEIIYAILQPIREWNEKPPPVAYHNPQTFPYHFHWLQAVVAHLLTTAAHWYERNRLPASHGGITVDAKAKANPYLAVAQLMRKEWLEFVMNKKISINAGLFMGHVGSGYY
jgi:hypothetical protein